MVKNDLLVLTQNAATKENVQNTFHRLWTNSDLSDVTLATEDGSQLKAHKVILASTSVFFENLFKRTNHPNILVYLKGVTKSRLEMLLKFVYLSQVEVPAEELESFLDMGREFQISGLLDNDGFSEKERVIPLTPEPSNRAANNTGKVDLFEKHGGSFQSTSNYVPSLAKETNVPKGSREIVIGCKLTKPIEPDERKDDSPNSLDESFSLLLESEHSEGEKGDEKRSFQTKLSKDKRFPCDQCDGMYASKASLYGHKRYIHERAHLLEDNANKEGHHQSGARGVENRQIQNAAAPERKKNFMCDQCDMAFERTPDLFKHKKREHGGSLHACNQCDYESTQKENLDRHKKREHSGEEEEVIFDVDDRKNLYSCDHCDLNFPKLPQLYNHKKAQHTGALHSCEYCDYQATQLENLKRHKRVEHDN